MPESSRPLSSVCFALARAGAVLPAVVMSAARIASASPHLPQSIYGGTEVAECGWPSVVFLDDGVRRCTGTLVHPEVVLFAGHCFAQYEDIVFGEDALAPARAVATDRCVILDSEVAIGRDIGACRLAEPVTDVPIVPILMGCELDALQIGAEVAMIGFGFDQDGGLGVKREATSKIAEFIENNEVYIHSDDGGNICHGDSGGPAILQLPDGGWRVFGVTSYIYGDCGNGGYYVTVHNHVEWLENQLNVDITPCHTADGTWDPGPECGGFALQPGVASGTWATGCQAGLPLAGPSSTCGPAYEADADDTPPHVEIVGLTSGQQFASEGSLPLKVTAKASDDPEKPDGWGIAEVRLVVNEKELPGGTREAVPYGWNVALPTGGYWISALAIDHAGNEAYAAPIAIGVNAPAPTPSVEETTGEAPTTGEASSTGEEPTSGGGDTHDESGSDGASEGGATTAASDQDDSGCGCRQRDDAAGALGLLVLLGLRRRRRA